jgi:hypothetical protein
MLQRVIIRPRQTFDSSATPKPGEASVAPKTLADVDIAALQARMAGTIERAQADDPKHLRERIAELERRLAVPLPEPVRVEVPVLDDTQVADLRAIARSVEALAGGFVVAARGIIERLDGGGDPGPVELVTVEPRPSAHHGVRAGKVVKVEPVITGHVDRADVDLTPYARRLIDTLAQRHPMTPTRAQLAVLSKSSPKSSAFDGAIALLRKGGFVTVEDGMFHLTDEGWRNTETGRAPPDDLLEHWRHALPTHARVLLDTLVEAHPEALSRAEIAERSGRSPNSSAFDAGIALLRKMSLVIGDGAGYGIIPELVS